MQFMRPARFLPADGHVGFDDFLGSGEVTACVEHVEADGVEFISGGTSEAVAGDVAGADFVFESEQSFGDDPDVARAAGDSQDLFVRVVFLRDVLGLFKA